MKISLAAARGAFLIKRDARKLLFRFSWKKPKTLPRKNFKFSAYLSIYNDWDLLVPALQSIAGYVDELVVVDGAYEWMVPYLKATGSDPLRSDARVYAALDACGIPYRTINRIWGNEAEKRFAGYDACTHRYVYRIDADEVLFFNDHALDAFLGSTCAIAEMQMPLYVAPGWIVRATGLRGLVRKIPSQICLFDREKITAGAHLKYLWLVLAGDSPSMHDKETFSVFERPVAFCAHLSGWRTAETAVNRGAFYVMNWMRHHEVSWLPDLRGLPAADFEAVFKTIPATQFKNALTRGRFPMGTIMLSSREALTPSPLSKHQEHAFAECYPVFLKRLATQNRDAAENSQTLIFGEPAFFDISTAAARYALSTDGSVLITTSVPFASLTLRVHTLAAMAPFYTAEELPCLVAGTELRFELPPIPPNQRGALRQAIEVVGYFGKSGDGGGLCSFRIGKPSPDRPLVAESG